MPSEIIKNLQWRYATKKFDPNKKLSDDQVTVLKAAFNLTATSYGLQPLRMLVISDDKIKEQLPPITMKQLQVRDASHVLVFCVEETISQQFVRDHFNRVEEIRNTDRKILDDYEDYLLDYFSNKNEAEIRDWITKQAYLAMGNLLTVCAAEGIDSCPMEGFEPDKYDELLQLKDLGLRSVLVMPVGFRAEDDMFASMKKVRRGIGDVVIDLD